MAARSFKNFSHSLRGAACQNVAILRGCAIVSLLDVGVIDA